MSEDVTRLRAENARLTRQLEQVRQWLNDYHAYLVWDRDLTTASRVRAFLSGAEVMTSHGRGPE